MNFNEYQDLASRTMNLSLDPMLALATSGLGIAGESGEVADHIKKHVGHGHDLDHLKVIKELGDVLWYVAVLARQMDISMDDIARLNITKLKARYPEGFTEEASKNRKPGDV